MVRFLANPCRRPVLDRIRNDRTLSALALCCPLSGPRRMERAWWPTKVERQVHALFGQPLLRPEVLERLRADPALTEPVRQRALALAEVAGRRQAS